ncbi:MAG: hypothetical protein ABIJ00_12800 [Candidatus Eisenbacteria bacterium]
MTRRIGILVIIAVGVLWGLSEVFVGDVFYRFQVPMRAAVLTALGIALLVAGRLISDRPGSSLGSALIAGALRCLMPKLYICHFIAITLTGCAFDASWTASKAGERHSLRRAWLSSAIAAYSGFLAFAFAGAYIFGFGRWVAAGIGGILEFGLKSGTLSTILLAGLVPLVAFGVRRAVTVYRRSPDASSLPL